MTVQTLIEELLKLPREAQVLTPNLPSLHPLYRHVDKVQLREFFDEKFVEITSK